MNAINLVVYPVKESAGYGINQETWYLIGIILAILLLGYLVYSVLKPEDF